MESKQHERARKKGAAAFYTGSHCHYKDEELKDAFEKGFKQEKEIFEHIKRQNPKQDTFR